MFRDAFSAGFRPFFLLAAVNAWASMLPWLYVLAGGAVPTQGWPPQTLHAHEMIYGTVVPVIAGFLLTAVPNWTSTARVQGAALAAAAALYLAGRFALVLAGTLSALQVACIDIAFLPALACLVGVPIVRARNWRNLGVVGILLGLALANAAIHRGLAFGDAAMVRGATWGAVYLIVMLMLIIAGRITPVFTRNALRRQGVEAEIVSRRPVGAVAISLGALAMLADLLEPRSQLAAMLGLCAFPLLLVRQSGWGFFKTLDQPILWILHVGHVWLAVGFACLGLSNAFGVGIGAAAVHAFTAGAMGTLILGMMPRVSLGHSGRPIVAGPMTVAMFACVIAGAAIRIVGAAGAVEAYRPSVLIGGGLWAIAWLIFTIVYSRVLVRPDAA
ncbi:MAG: NnrS family protein [bacterium]|nr:NnrS family protein [bacterium]